MKNLRFAAIFLALSLPMTIHAAQPIEDFGRCLGDNTSGKDRKDLAKWVFMAMATHPEIAPLSATTPAIMETSQKAMGVLVTRLIADNCPNEMRAAVKAHGSNGIKAAFEILGRIAMQELTSNADVTSALTGFERFMDKTKVERVLKPD
jgi:predicted secreted protein